MSRTVELYFCAYSRASALGQHRAYVEGVSDKLFSEFDNIETEADQHAEQAYERFGQMPGWEDGPDLSELAEAAFEQGLEKYENLMFVKGQLCALATAGMYHLWEKTLKAFILRELQHYGLTEEGKREIENANHRTLTEWLSAMGFELGGKAYLEDLETCRLIANTIKHGDGSSCRRLAEHAPDLLNGPYGSDIRFGDPKADDLWIEPQTFERLAEAVEAFWTEMPETLVVPSALYEKEGAPA